MSFQEQLVSNMFDPTNRLVTRMVDQEAINQRNAGQQALAQGTLAQQSLWTYDASGRLVMRDVDEALAIAKGIHAMNNVGQQPALPQASNQLTAQDIVNIVVTTMQQLMPQAGAQTA